MDNVHDAGHAVFQPRPSQGRTQPPEQMRRIRDLNVDSDGVLTTRAGAVLSGAALSGGRQFVGSGLQIAGALLNAARAPLATTSGDLVFAEHGLSIYWSDGAKTGRLYGGVSTNWGCEVAPMPTLAARSGSLIAGTYAVAATYLDALGVEHGADVAAQITLSATGGITASVLRTDPSAVGVRWYLAGPHGEALYWVGDTSGFSAAITEPASTTIVCDRIGLMPPMPATALLTWRDFILVGDGKDLYPSVGQAVHLFEPTANVQQFPQDVLCGAGLKDGFYVVTQDQLYWVEGAASPQAWRPDPIGHGVKYASGSLKVSASMLPALQMQSDTEIALFASTRGLVVGLPGGQVLMPTAMRIHFDAVGKRVKFAVDDFKLYVVLS